MGMIFSLISRQGERAAVETSASGAGHDTASAGVTNVRREGRSIVVRPPPGEEPVEVLYSYGVTSSHGSGKIFLLPGQSIRKHDRVGELLVTALKGGGSEYTFTPEPNYAGELRLRVAGKDVPLPPTLPSRLGSQIQIDRTESAPEPAEDFDSRFRTFKISVRQSSVYASSASFDAPKDTPVRLFLGGDTGRHVCIGELTTNSPREYTDSTAAALFRVASGPDRDSYSLGIKQGFKGSLVIETSTRMFKIKG